MSLVVYVVDGIRALDHLAIETVLLDELAPCKDTLLLFYKNHPCIIIGRNQNPWREVNPDSILPVFRRSSGGGTVYHDQGNLNWALIMPRVSHDQNAELHLISNAVRACGFDVRPGERGGLYVGGSSKFVGRKVSGTARRFASRRVLHHGTLLVASDMTALRGSLGGLATYDDNSLPSVPASPINLAEIKPGTNLESIIDGMTFHLTGQRPEKIPNGLVKSAELDETRKILASPDWIYGATPPFSVRLGSGMDAVNVRVEKGRVVEFGDSAGKDWLAAIRGEPFSFSLAKTITQRAAGMMAAGEEGL